MMKRYLSAILCSMLIVICTQSTVQATTLWNGIIDPARAVDWSKVGVIGGNPQTGGLPSDSWTACATAACTTLATPANVTAANINTAINSANGSNTYIQIPAGTFTMSTGLVWQTITGVELRGAGSNSTFFNFTGNNACEGVSADVCFEDSSTNYQGGPTNVANWTAGYSAGATTITLSSVANLKVGYPIILDQLDDSSDTGQAQFTCSGPTTCATAGSGGYTRTGGGCTTTCRSQAQMVTVTQCDGNSTTGHTCSSGTNITISPGLYRNNWDINGANSAPQAWWTSTPGFNNGIRNISLNHTTSDPADGIEFFNVSGGWVSGVRSIYGQGTTSDSQKHVGLWNSPHITIQNSYFYHNRTNGNASVLYGIAIGLTSDSLIQNNICQQIQACVPEDGPGSGTVIAYNFDVNNEFQSPTWQQQGEFAHSVADFMLMEGNQGAGVYMDNFHGTHYLNTLFRNSYNGFQQNQGSITNSSTTPLLLLAYSRDMNIIGNVLGSPALPAKTYQTVEPSAPTSLEIYAIGWADNSGSTIPNDSLTNTSLYRWGNYDIKTAAVRWCGNSGDPGWSTTCSSTSEVPTGDATFPQAVPSSTTLPPSFYLSSVPSWWASSIPWPANGPDVTSGNLRICHGGTNQGAYVTTSGQCPSSTLDTLGGFANQIPAANCFLNIMGGSPIGTDASALAFDSNACYPQTSPTSPAGPMFAKVVAH